MNDFDKALIRDFRRWLVKMGAERKHTAAAWEVMRFATSRGLLIVWESKRGLKFNPVARELFERCRGGSTDRVAPREKGERGDPALLNPPALLAWVRAHGRVTVADLVKAAGGYLRDSYLRLVEMERAGMLVSEGGGPGEPIYWRAAQ